MRKVGPNSFTEIYFAGCNPSFVETSDGYVMIDSPQQPIDAVRWRERMEDNAPIRYLINTEPHGDHITGNAYLDRKSTRLNSSHQIISYAVFCLKKKKRAIRPSESFRADHQ